MFRCVCPEWVVEKLVSYIKDCYFYTFYRPKSFVMNKKYFLLFFISTLLNCYSLMAQSTVSANLLAFSTNSGVPIHRLSSEQASVAIGSPCFAVDLNGGGSVTGVADSLRFIKMKEYFGKDSTFVKDQRVSIGTVRFPGVKNLVGGVVMYFGYEIRKTGGESPPMVDSILVKAYPLTSGTDPITVLSSASEVTGNKIAFAISAIDIISWDGKPWGAPTTIYLNYDISNGKYSIQINQWRPATN